MEEFSVIMIILIVLALLIPLFAIIDIARKDYAMTKKLMWIAIVIFVPYLGSIIYFLMGRK